MQVKFTYSIASGKISISAGSDFMSVHAYALCMCVYVCEHVCVCDMCVYVYVVYACACVCKMASGKLFLSGHIACSGDSFWLNLHMLNYRVPLQGTLRDPSVEVFFLPSQSAGSPDP